MSLQGTLIFHFLATFARKVFKQYIKFGKLSRDFSVFNQNSVAFMHI